MKKCLTNRGGDGHVSVALLGHQDRGDEVGHRGPGRQEGQTHHRVRDAHNLAGDGGPPDHQVGEHHDPHDAHCEGEGKVLLPMVSRR